MVTFKRCNLKEPRSLSGPFDLIFMRNVIIYFDDKFKRELLARIARLLEPAGYLFLGTGETVSGYTEAFDILEYERGLFYRVKAGSVRV